jgi:hypothetical protein
MINDDSLILIMESTESRSRCCRKQKVLSSGFPPLICPTSQTLIAARHPWLTPSAQFSREFRIPSARIDGSVSPRISSDQRHA